MIGGGGVSRTVALLLTLPATLLGGATAGRCAAAASETPLPRLVRLSPELDRLLPPDTKVEPIVTGLQWLEGPVWDPQREALLFSDIPANAVRQWRRGDGHRLLLHPSGYTGSAPFIGREPGSNGLVLDSAGRLVLCQHGDRRVARLGANGRFETLADRYRGKRLNSPNDAVYASNGDLYFTDPPFGLPGTFDDPARELDFAGVFRLSAAGELDLLTSDLSAPNGIALSPAEDRLYVSNADPRAPVWWELPLSGGRVSVPARVLHDASSDLGPGVIGFDTGLPDGLVVDEAGNLFAAGPLGVWVLDPLGDLLGRIDLGGPTGNCAWGEDGSTLFVTSGSSVFRIETSTRGRI